MIRLGTVSLFIILSIPSLVLAQVGVQLETQIPVPTPSVTVVAISDGGGMLAVGDSDGRVFCYDRTSGELVGEFRDHTKAVSAITFSHDGEYVISASEDQSIFVRTAKPGERTGYSVDFGDKAVCLCTSPDDRILAACGSSKQIRLWEFPSGVKKGELEGHKKDVLFVAFGATGRELISVAEDRRIIWWNTDRLESNRQIEIDVHTIANSGIDILSAAANIGSRFIAIGIDEHVLEKGGRDMRFEHNVAIYDYDRASLVKVLRDNQRTVDAIHTTKNGCYVVLNSSTLRHESISLRNVKSGTIDCSCDLTERLMDYSLASDSDFMVAAVAPESGDSICRVNCWKIDVAAPDISCLISKFSITSEENPILHSGDRHVIAVMPFDCSKLPDELGESMPRFLETHLINSPYVRLVERSKISAVIEELEFQGSRYVEAQAAKIGKILGAEYLLLGSVDKLDNDVVITAKLVDTESAEIIGVREIHCNNCSAGDMFEAASYLAPTIAAETSSD